MATLLGSSVACAHRNNQSKTRATSAQDDRQRRWMRLMLNSRGRPCYPKRRLVIQRTSERGGGPLEFCGQSAELLTDGRERWTLFALPFWRYANFTSLARCEDLRAPGEPNSHTPRSKA